MVSVTDNWGRKVLVIPECSLIKDPPGLLEFIEKIVGRGS